jgi:hypothetical protein
VPAGSWRARLVRRLAALVTVGLLAGDASAASPKPPSAEWVRYAGLVGEAVRLSLDASRPEAERLRADLEASAAQSPASLAKLRLNVWVASDGVITRAESAMLKDDAVSDLRSLLVGHALGLPPPKTLPFPIRLEVNLEQPADENKSAAAP